LVRRLDRAIDGVRPFKERRRGLTGAQLLVALAESMLGGDHLAHLDVLRQDVAVAELRTVAEALAPETVSLLPRVLRRARGARDRTAISLLRPGSRSSS
jgi:hypothetical protein